MAAPGGLFDASGLPSGVGRPEAFSCLVLRLQRCEFTLGCAGRCGRPPICFLAGRRARMTAKPCESHEEAWIWLLAGFMPAFGRGPKKLCACMQGLSHCSCHHIAARCQKTICVIVLKSQLREFATFAVTLVAVQELHCVTCSSLHHSRTYTRTQARLKSPPHEHSKQTRCSTASSPGPRP